MIRSDLGVSCAADLVKVGTTVSGNNGYRQEQWFFKSCVGDIEYIVEYFPPQAFPGRSNHLTVHKRPQEASGAKKP